MTPDQILSLACQFNAWPDIKREDRPRLSTDECRRLSRETIFSAGVIRAWFPADREDVALLRERLHLTPEQATDEQILEASRGTLMRWGVDMEIASREFGRALSSALPVPMKKIIRRLASH